MAWLRNQIMFGCGTTRYRLEAPICRTIRHPLPSFAEQVSSSVWTRSSELCVKDCPIHASYTHIGLPMALIRDAACRCCICRCSWMPVPILLTRVILHRLYSARRVPRLDSCLSFVSIRSHWPAKVDNAKDAGLIRCPKYENSGRWNTSQWKLRLRKLYISIFPLI